MAKLSLHLREQGDGKPIVFVHAFPLDSRCWSRQIDALSKDFRCVSVDLPGFGGSGEPTPFSIAGVARSLHERLDDRGLLPCTLGGLSMGGYVALAFATKFFDDLTALVLTDTRSSADDDEGKAKRNQMIEIVRKKGVPAIVEQMLPNMLAEASRLDAALVDEIRGMMLDQPPDAVEHALAAMRDRESFEPILSSLDVPTLILVGEDDTITPPTVAQAMYRAMPRAKLKTVDGAGHLSPIEKPEQVNEAIADFLREF